jgi:prolyl oligopeptidase
VNYIKSNYPEISGLKDEIRAYLDRDYRSAPFYKSGREFFWARKKGEQQSKLYTKLKGKEVLIFDPMVFDSTGKSSPAGPHLTEDGSKAAMGLQKKGNEIYTYRIIDTKTGKVLGEPLINLSDFGWTKDEKSAYITVRSKEIIEKQIPLPTYLHKLADGSNMQNDVLVGSPKDAKDFFSIWDDRESDLTILSNGDFYSNTLRIRKQGTLDEPTVIASSNTFHYDIGIKHNKIFYFTNDNAPNFKLMVADLAAPNYSDAKVFYPEQKDMVLEGFTLTDKYVIIQLKKDVITIAKLYDYNGNYIKDLTTPELGDIAGIGYDKFSKNIYISLNTFTNPTRQFRLNEEKLEWEFVYQDNPPVNTEGMESKMVFYPSKDGTKIPMFLIYKKGVKLDGKNPTMLYGYGGFNISQQPNFIGATASFIKRGGVYAIACLRGGSEYGENWHRAGMLANKQNVFDDFITAGEYLIREKYTNPTKLLIRGGSNGGLLTGAVTMQRPDLFKAVVCAVPLLDMHRYHKFLIARYWIPEYGDADQKKDFDFISKYSPYQNIRQGVNYPTMLIKAGENDARVDPLHAKKMAAALQNSESQTNPILLFVDFESGHGSGQSIDQMVENSYLEWKFIMGELGVK